MKKIFSVVLILVVSFFVFASAQKEDVLTVYCYDSFTGDWGPGNDIVAAFKEKTGIDVNLVGCGGSVETYSKVLYEGSSCTADMVIGLSDTSDIDKSLFDSYKAFDYGIYAFMFDSECGLPEPKSLKALTNKQYKDKVVLIDPRTSSVGLGLLKWTIDALGEKEAFSWWEEMKENSLTIASSWSSAYGLFTEGEVPLVISYTTSPVYHAMYDNTTRYKALEFSDGHVSTTEYMGILKTSKNKEKAALFMDFILDEGQSTIAVANTMFPVNKETVLPPEFEYAIIPTLLEEDLSFVKKEETYLKMWSDSMVK